MNGDLRRHVAFPRARVVAGLSVWSVAAALVVVAHLRLETRVQRRARQSVESAANAWTSLVTAGVPPDSASQRSLAILREGFRGRRTRWTTPFTERANVDSVWQGAYLNPFRVPQSPRTQEEAEALRVSREDIRLATTVGLAELRGREAARLRWFDSALLVGSVVVAGFVFISQRHLAAP